MSPDLGRQRQPGRFVFACVGRMEGRRCTGEFKVSGFRQDKLVMGLPWTCEACGTLQMARLVLPVSELHDITWIDHEVRIVNMGLEPVVGAAAIEKAAAVQEALAEPLCEDGER